VAAIDEGWIDLECENVPSDVQPLVADFLNFTYAGDVDADKLREQVEQHRAVRLAF
jgi:hypothetical protein